MKMNIRVFSDKDSRPDWMTRRDDLLEVLLRGYFVANAIETTAGANCYEHIDQAFEGACKVFDDCAQTIHNLHTYDYDYNAVAAIAAYRAEYGYSL